MKNKILILALAMFISMSTRAQNYPPFPVNYGSWVYQLYDQFHHPAGVWMSVTLFGDTIIGANTYKKLYGNANSCLGTNYVREDNKIIYYYSPDSAAEYVLYDFNLLVGDTIFNPYCCWQDPDHDTVIVAQIDSSLLADNQYHKYWFAQDCVHWIEGVGNELGLLNAYTFCPLSGTFWLECFYNDSGFVYGSSLCPLGINNINEKTFSTLSPNPFTTTATINFSKEIRSGSLRLINLFGQTVLEKNNINGSSIIINRGNLSSGVYLFEVTEKGNRIYSGKAVVY